MQCSEQQLEIPSSDVTLKQQHLEHLGKDFCWSEHLCAQSSIEKNMLCLSRYIFLLTVFFSHWPAFNCLFFYCSDALFLLEIFFFWNYTILISLLLRTRVTTPIKARMPQALKTILRRLFYPYLKPSFEKRILKRLTYLKHSYCILSIFMCHELYLKAVKRQFLCLFSTSYSTFQVSCMERVLLKNGQKYYICFFIIGIRLSSKVK